MKWQQPQHREDGDRVGGILKLPKAGMPPCLRSVPAKLLSFFPITFLSAPLLPRSWSRKLLRADGKETQSKQSVPGTCGVCKVVLECA